MMKTIVFLLLIAFGTYAHADEIKFHRAGTYKNVKVIDTTGAQIVYLRFEGVIHDTVKCTKLYIDDVAYSPIDGDSKYRDQYWDTPPTWAVEMVGRPEIRGPGVGQVKQSGRIGAAALLANMPAFPNATPQYVKITHPQMAVALPLGILFGIGAIFSFVAAADVTDPSAEAATPLYITGAIGTGLSIYFISVAFYEERWVVYSNGMEIRVTVNF